jgi:anaerobic selenocysteine-containing dehydrogenase
MRTVHGTCHHDCPDSCGWTVTVDDQPAGPVAVQLRGTPEHPYSQGELCPKVNRFLDRVYSPDRLVHPLRRVGPRGSDQFERISWDDALDEIATRLHDVIDRHGAEAVLPFSDAGNQGVLAMLGLSSRFFHHLGASRLVRALCGPTVGAGMSMTNGSPLSLDPLEIVHSQLIVLWATNTRLTNRHLWPTIDAARRDGARLVVIDPIRTATARAIDPDRGDRFLQPRPGTDIALMLAIMHVLIREDLVDHDWIGQHTAGFDELSEHVAAWTPERAAHITGLAVRDIEEFARDYGTIRPAVIRTLIGAEHHENGAMFHRTLACLPALVGAWNDRGGGLSRSVGSWQDLLLDDFSLHRPDLLAGRSPRWINMSRLGEALTDTEHPVHALVVWNSNPLVVVPNAELTRRGLERPDLFTVVHEQFLTDTARYADIVLPATTQLETSDVVPSWGHLWMGWNEAAIEPVGECVSNTEFFRRLATAMGLTEPSLFDDDLTVLRDALPTVDIDALRRDGWIKVPYPDDGRPWAEGQFPTPSGRVELVNPRLASMGQPTMPTYVPPREGPGGDPELFERFPLQLLTPKHHTRFLNSSYPQLPRHGGPEGGPFVELDPDDAAARGLAEGDLASVWNDRASVDLPVRVSDRLRPGVVAIPFGWWMQHHPDGRVANSLTNDTLTDWGGGVAYSDTLVEVARCTSSSSSSVAAT